MPRSKNEDYCDVLEEYVEVTVFYKKIATLCYNGTIPTGCNCSAALIGRCDKYNVCPILKRAQDNVGRSVY